MSNFLDKLNGRLATALQGSNGPDTLGRWAMTLGLLFALLNIFFYNMVFTALSFMLMSYAVYRLFSRNVPARQAEDERFRSFVKRPTDALRRLRRQAANRKTTVYLTCKECGQHLSVPKGKGKMRVVCPKCKHETTIRT